MWHFLPLIVFLLKVQQVQVKQRYYNGLPYEQQRSLLRDHLHNGMRAFLSIFAYATMPNQDCQSLKISLSSRLQPLLEQCLNSGFTPSYAQVRPFFLWMGLMSSQWSKGKK